MSDIHALEANLDLKQNLNVYANCKQLDVLHLIFNIFDGGLQADLTNYKVRLKAMKADNVLLIQDTQYTINKNVVTIIPNEQLTTASGTTKIELQFINTKTGEKKATFNLTLKVTPSVLENERSISTATYTLMDELENKLDKAASFFENINKAIDANTTLVATTNNANTSNTNLNATISAGNTLKTALDLSNTTANATKASLNASNTDALATKSALNTSNTNAAATKTALDASNTAANTTKTNLDSSNSTANTTKTDLDKSNANALATKADLDKLNTTANATKADLTAINDKASVTKKDLIDINTTASVTKTNLDAENVRAKANITAMESFGDITSLSKNVTSLKAEIENARGGEVDLDSRLDKAALQLSDINKNKAENTDPARTTKDKTVTGAINELNSNKINKYDGVISDFNAALTQGEYMFTNTTINGAYANSYGKVIVTVNDGGTHNNTNNWIWQTAYYTQGDVCYRNKTNSSAWSAWTKLANNNGTVQGNLNADMVDGVHVANLAQTKRLTAAQINNAYLPSGIYTNAGDGILNGDGSAFRGYWWHIFASYHWDNNGYGGQIAIPLDGGTPANASDSMYFRCAVGGTYTPWKRVAHIQQSAINTLYNGWAFWSNTSFGARYANKVGNLCTIDLMVTNATPNQSAVFYLPEGFRPYRNLIVPVSMSSSPYTVPLEILTDGTVHFVINTPAANAWVHIHATFQTD